MAILPEIKVQLPIPQYSVPVAVKHALTGAVVVTLLWLANALSTAQPITWQALLGTFLAGLAGGGAVDYHSFKGQQHGAMKALAAHLRAKQGPPKQLVGEMPRRNCLNHLMPAELTLYHAAQNVEKLGAHPWLTEVVVMLGEAKERLADWVELKGPKGAQVPVKRPTTTKRRR